MAAFVRERSLIAASNVIANREVESAGECSLVPRRGWLAGLQYIEHPCREV